MVFWEESMCWQLRLELSVMSGGAWLKKWPPQLTHWTNLGTNLDNKGNPIEGRSASRNAWLNCFRLNLVNIECASPILIWTFILWAIVLRKVPQTGNSSMARTPAFFADCLRASPWHSVTKTQKAKSKIVHWQKKLVIIMFMQCMWNLENWPSIHYKYNFGVMEAPVCLKSKYKMFQPDLDVCVNFTCVRRHHHMSNETTLFQDLSTEMSD